jgi:hypothetical protein
MAKPNCMNAAVYAAYADFLRARASSLRRISYGTRREYSVEDVQQEALVMAFDLLERKGMEPDFANADYQDLLISYLFNQLVRYNEKTLRAAEKLDHSSNREDADQPHWLLGQLHGDESENPLQVCLDAEEAQTTTRVEPPPHASQASAYVLLIRRFKHMRPLANYLLISASHCRRCFAKACQFADRQESLFDGCGSRAAACPMPQSWRRFRSERQPTQFCFDFIDAPTLWSERRKCVK